MLLEKKERMYVRNLTRIQTLEDWERVRNVKKAGCVQVNAKAPKGNGEQSVADADDRLAE